MKVIAVIAILAVIDKLVSLIYLWFRPKFINPKLFGQPESKSVMSTLYIVFILFNLVFIMHAFGVFKVDIK